MTFTVKLVEVAVKPAQYRRGLCSLLPRQGAIEGETALDDSIALRGFAAARTTAERWRQTRSAVVGLPVDGQGHRA